jgi:hypothetical protein
MKPILFLVINVRPEGEAKGSKTNGNVSGEEHQKTA